MDAVHARGLRETREQFQLQHENEMKAQGTQRNHQAALGAIGLESQRQLVQLTETAELSRMAKTLQLQEAHQDSQNKKAIEHARAQASHQLRAAGEAEQITSRALERRFKIETKHHAEMAKVQVSLVEGQARIMAGAQAATAPGGQARLGWRDGGVDAISLS